jgi:tetratricopeptide (TPR) repeat protein
VSTSTALGFLNRAREVEPRHARSTALYACIETFAKLRDEGNSAYAAGRWQEAYVAYTKCLTVDAYNSSLKAIILCNRSAVCIQCERWKDALDDITQSIGYNPQNAKAYTRRARIHHQQQSHDLAVRDLQLAVQMYPSADNQERLQQALDARTRARGGAAPNAGASSSSNSNGANNASSASSSFRFFNFASGGGNGSGSNRPSTAGNRRPQSAQQQRQQRQQQQQQQQPAEPSLYDVLGIQRGCDERSVVKAYRDGALRWHPDKWASATDTEQKTAEEKFKLISTAYSTLKEADKRRQYDQSTRF